MRKLILFFSFALFFACGRSIDSVETNSGNILENLTYSVDTVVIDSKDGILYLNTGLQGTYLAKDASILYNYNPKPHQLEVIDLKTLTLKKLIPLEKEGPSGIGNSGFFTSIQVLENGEIFFSTGLELIRLSADHKSSEKFKFNSLTLSGDTLALDQEIRYSGSVSDDGLYYFTFYGNSSDADSREGLAVIDLEGKFLKKISLPIFEELSQFEIAMEIDGGIQKYTEPIFIVQKDSNNLILSSLSLNEAYIVDFQSGDYSHLPFKSELTSNQVEVNYPINARNREEGTEAIQARWKQVIFNELEWDEESSMFWRISKEQVSSDSDQPVFQLVVTFFDRDLMQIGEFQIPEDWKVTGRPFVSQGMYWQFLNIADEMAFVRFKPNLSEGE